MHTLYQLIFSRPSINYSSTNTYTHPGLAIQVLKFITVGRDILYVYKYVNAVHRAAYSLCGMYTV